jgi:hypothetical protein
MIDYRQTELTLGGRPVIVFTEALSARDLKTLEARHTKAVKAALVEWRTAKAEAQYKDTASTAKRVRKAAEARHVKLGFKYGTPEGAGDNAVRQLMTGAEQQRTKARSAAKRFPKLDSAYVDCRKPDAVKYTSVDPDALAEFLGEGVTHEYVTDAPVSPVAAPAPAGGDYLRTLLSRFA